jgi:hypothetical protein
MEVINTFIAYIFSCILCRPILIPLITAIKGILLGDGGKVHDLLLEIYLRENSKEYSFVLNYDVLIITNIYENFSVTVVEIHSSLRFASNRI